MYSKPFERYHLRNTINYVHDLYNVLTGIEGVIVWKRIRGLEVI